MESGWQQGGKAASGRKVVSERANGKVSFERLVSGKKVAEWLLGGNKMALSERHLSGIQVASKVAKRWQSGFWVATRWHCQRGI